MGLDRSHWTLLAALRREETLTGAAEALGITQSAASQRLREAERRLGIPLAERRGKRVSLNPGGLRIAEAGAVLEQLLTTAERDAVWIGRRTPTPLRIAWTHYDALEHAALMAESGARIEGGVAVEFVRTTAGDPARWLMGGDADVAVLPRMHTSRALLSRALVADRLVAVAPRALVAPGCTTLGPEDFADRPFLTYGLLPEPGWEYERFFAGSRFVPSQLVMVESTEVILALVARGQGLSILPRRSIPSQLPGGLRCLDLAGPPIALEWRLHRRIEDPQPLARRIDAFTAALIQALDEDAPRMLPV
ncbi:MAG: LysR family transcriptional regulator [Candidatus Competibacterales bacterium]